MHIINELNKICELVIQSRIAYEENLMLMVLQGRRWKPHCLSYLKWEKMQLFKETASASGFCARPNAALFLQNQTEGDSEFSR